MYGIGDRERALVDATICCNRFWRGRSTEAEMSAVQNFSSYVNKSLVDHRGQTPTLTLHSATCESHS